MGWVRGYGNYRSDEQREGPVFILVSHSSSIVVGLLDFSGGILGWDPVHTTCIHDEMMMRL